MSYSRIIKWEIRLAAAAVLAIGVLVQGGCGKTAQSQPQPQQRQFIAVLIDGTGFAERYWEPSLETATLLLKNVVTPKSIVCVMKIDDYSYEEDNVLLGPKSMPAGGLRLKVTINKFNEQVAALQAPEQIKPGTDIDGALHMLGDYLAKWPDAWLNLLVFSDLVEEYEPAGRLGSARRLPELSRVVSFFVAYGASEGEYKQRQESWKRAMAEYGVDGSEVSFFDPQESLAENLPAEFVRDFCRPPAN